MRHVHLRLSVRGAIVAVALVALNLAAALAAARHYPRPALPFYPYMNTTVIAPDGSIFLYDHEAPPGKPPRLLRPPRPTLLKIWSPVAASAAFTLLVLFIALRRPAWWRRIAPPDWRRFRAWFTVRRSVIAAFLAGLNLAGAIATASYYPRPLYLPIPVNTGARWHPRTSIFTEKDGTLAIHDMSIPGHTLAIRSDGSHTLYEGGRGSIDLTRRPPQGVGDLRPLETRPHRLLRPPRPTLLLIWSPVLASVTLSLVILSVARRHSVRGLESTP